VLLVEDALGEYAVSAYSDALGEYTVPVGEYPKIGEYPKVGEYSVGASLLGEYAGGLSSDGY
jgi:hypothetical protein